MMFLREPVKASMPAKLITTIMAMLPYREARLLYFCFITKKREGKMKLRGTKPAQQADEKHGFAIVPWGIYWKMMNAIAPGYSAIISSAKPPFHVDPKNGETTDKIPQSLNQEKPVHS